MNKSQIRKTLQEVECILQNSKRVTVFAFVEETEKLSQFHIKENTCYPSGKCQVREFDVDAESATKASEIYHSMYVPEGCEEVIVFLLDFGE